VNEQRYFHLLERIGKAFWDLQLAKLRYAWLKHGTHRQYSINDCLSHLKREVSELEKAIASADRWEVEKECADVANCALMIYDLVNLRSKSRPLSWIDEEAT